MEHKRLTKAIQEHVWNGEKWPGLCGHGNGKLAFEIASDIIRETQRVDNVFFPSGNGHGHLADSLSYCVELATSGRLYEHDFNVPWSALATTAGGLSRTDVASALYIVRLVGNVAASLYSFVTIIKWRKCLLEIGTVNLETLFSGQIKLAVPIWAVRHLYGHDEGTERRLRQWFGIDFMERMILEHGDDLSFVEFWDDVLKFLPCWAACRLLKSMNCCSFSWTGSEEDHYLPSGKCPRSVDDLEKIPGFMDDWPMTMALLIARNSDQFPELEPNIALLDKLLHGGEFYPPIPEDELYSRTDLLSALAIMQQLEKSGLTTWQLADVCAANPGWTPFQSDFDCVVQEYKTKVAIAIRSALSRPPENSGENVAKLVLGFLVNDQ